MSEQQEGLECIGGPLDGEALVLNSEQPISTSTAGQRKLGEYLLDVDQKSGRLCLVWHRHEDRENDVG